jgi:hypothetical protein
MIMTVDSLLKHKSGKSTAQIPAYQLKKDEDNND